MNDKNKNEEELVVFVCTDLGSINRGRAVPLADLPEMIQTGVGWVPINQTISPFDQIPESDLWGSHGDRRLLPDPSTEVRVDLALGYTPLHFFLCDITHPDGSAWDVCARTFLKKTIADLKERTGCSVQAGFEHEFAFTDTESVANPGFSLSRLRSVEPFGTHLVQAMRQAGQEPETFLPEFGAAQFELNCKPALALAAADRSVIMRELVHETARQHGRKASFTPKLTPDALGSGTHIHFSLLDEAGKSRTYDAERPGRLSETAGQFSAGIVKYLPAILAFTAPSVLSYERLVPHSWSGPYACLGERNREAALRICPTVEISGRKPDEQLHLEYRACDATANPYLALGMLIRAGTQGIEEQLTQPALVNTDPSEMFENELTELAVVRLPATAKSALETMQASEVVKSWISADMLASYVLLREAEIAEASDKSLEELTLMYRQVY